MKTCRVPPSFQECLTRALTKNAKTSHATITPTALPHVPQ